uniref:Uncharacterized protein n=1 Tax=Magallana gigas TaxID=29159 RepID=K1QTZ7_MAGGI
MLNDGVGTLKVEINEHSYLSLLNVEVVDCGSNNSFPRIFMREGTCGHPGKEIRPVQSPSLHERYFAHTFYPILSRCTIYDKSPHLARIRGTQPIGNTSEIH